MRKRMHQVLAALAVVFMAASARADLTLETAFVTDVQDYFVSLVPIAITAITAVILAGLAIVGLFKLYGWVRKAVGRG